MSLQWQAGVKLRLYLLTMSPRHQHPRLLHHYSSEKRGVEFFPPAVGRSSNQYNLRHGNLAGTIFYRTLGSTTHDVLERCWMWVERYAPLKRPFS